MAAARGDALRGQIARTRVAALRPRLAHLRLRATASTLGLGQLVVTVNGSVWSEADYEEPAAVDPGSVLIEVTAPGHERWAAHVTVQPGPSTAVLDVPDLVPLGSRSEAAASTSTRSGSHLSALDGQESSSVSAFTMTSLILGGLGVVSLGTGLYFGFKATDLAGESKQTVHCPLPDACRSSGLRLREEAAEAAHRADIAVGIGATLVLTAAVVYWLAPSKSGEDVSQASVSLDGADGLVLNWHGDF